MSDLTPYVEWTSPAAALPTKGRFHIAQSLQEIFTNHRAAISEAYGITVGIPFYDYLWNRLWMDSPLSQARMMVVRTLFAEYRANRWEESDLRAFLSALDYCLESSVEIQISLTPPSHGDLGFRTIFPHCPKCKLELQRCFSKPTDDSIYKCELCGTESRLSDTYSQHAIECG